MRMNPLILALVHGVQRKRTSPAEPGPDGPPATLTARLAVRLGDRRDRPVTGDPAADGTATVTHRSTVSIPGKTQHGRMLPATVYTPSSPGPRRSSWCRPGSRCSRTQYASYARHLATWGFAVVLTDYADTGFGADHAKLAQRRAGGDRLGARADTARRGRAEDRGRGPLARRQGERVRGDARSADQGGRRVGPGRFEQPVRRAREDGLAHGRDRRGRRDHQRQRRLPCRVRRPRTTSRASTPPRHRPRSR